MKPGSDYYNAKHDKDKLPMQLIPSAWLEELARVLAHGASVYGPYKWLTVPDGIERYFGAAIRHLMSAKANWERGDVRVNVSDDALPSLVQAAINCLFIYTLQTKEWADIQERIDKERGRLAVNPQERVFDIDAPGQTRWARFDTRVSMEPTNAPVSPEALSSLCHLCKNRFDKDSIRCQMCRDNDHIMPLDKEDNTPCMNYGGSPKAGVDNWQTADESKPVSRKCRSCVYLRPDQAAVECKDCKYGGGYAGPDDGIMGEPSPNHYKEKE